MIQLDHKRRAFCVFSWLLCQFERASGGLNGAPLFALCSSLSNVEGLCRILQLCRVAARVRAQLKGTVFNYTDIIIMNRFEWCFCCH